MSTETGVQVMVEQTILFDNPDIENHVLLTGPFETFGDDILDAIEDLRAQAEASLGTPLKDEQCFYRFFERDA